MRNYTFPLVAVLLLATVYPSRAAEKPRATQGNQNQPKKIWTNEDLDELHGRGLISIVGTEVNEAAAPAVTGAAYPVYNSRLEDPDWYAEKAAELQAELEYREAALREEQTALALAAKGITQPGIAMDKPTIGATPQDALAILEALVGEVQSRLDELSDLARQNNIPPGVLRG